MEKGYSRLSGVRPIDSAGTRGRNEGRVFRRSAHQVANITDIAIEPLSINIPKFTSFFLFELSSFSLLLHFLIYYFTFSVSNLVHLLYYYHTATITLDHHIQDASTADLHIYSLNVSCKLLSDGYCHTWNTKWRGERWNMSDGFLEKSNFSQKHFL